MGMELLFSWPRIPCKWLETSLRLLSLDDGLQGKQRLLRVGPNDQSQTAEPAMPAITWRHRPNSDSGDRSVSTYSDVLPSTLVSASSDLRSTVSTPGGANHRARR